MTNIRPGQVLSLLDKNHLDRRLDSIFWLDKKIKIHDFSEIRVEFLIFENDTLTLLIMDLKFYIT